MSQTPPPLEVSLSEYSTDFAYVFKMEHVAAVAMEPAEADAEASAPSQQGALYPRSSSGVSLSAFLPHHFLLESSGSQADGKVSMAAPASYQVHLRNGLAGSIL